jgi:hypothetical protein
MAYTFNPTSGETALLAQVAARESSGNYTAVVLPQNCPHPPCTASGAYQFTDATWAMASNATGAPYYPTAASAPAWVQDTNALWLLRYAGGDPNASVAWGASGPYDTSLLSAGGSGQPLVDLSGAAAAAPTADILSQLGLSVDGTGIDTGLPTTGIVIALALGAVVYLASR